MNRLMFRLVAALLTCGVGLALTLACERYNTSVREEQARKRADSERVPCVARARQSLELELRRIDATYKELCRIPDLSQGGWPAIRDFEKFSRCNDEWAKARREAIKAAREPLLVMI